MFVCASVCVCVAMSWSWNREKGFFAFRQDLRELHFLGFLISIEARILVDISLWNIFVLVLANVYVTVFQLIKNSSKSHSEDVVNGWRKILL